VAIALHAPLGLPPPGEPPDEPEDEPAEPPALPPLLLEPELDPALEEEDAEVLVAVRVVPLQAEISKAAIISKANGRFGFMATNAICRTRGAPPSCTEVQLRDRSTGQAESA
jgi:hypothetical protein